MVPKTVSPRRTLGCSLAASALLHCLLGLPGICPSCQAAMLGGGNGAQSGPRAGGEADTLVCAAAAGRTVGLSGHCGCTCLLCTPQLHQTMLRGQDDVTATGAANGQPFSSAPVPPNDGHQRLARHVSLEAGPRTAPQRCALCCRFLL